MPRKPSRKKTAGRATPRRSAAEPKLLRDCESIQRAAWSPTKSSWLGAETTRSGRYSEERQRRQGGFGGGQGGAGDGFTVSQCAASQRSRVTSPTRAHQPMFQGSRSVVFSGRSPELW